VSTIRLGNLFAGTPDGVPDKAGTPPKSSGARRGHDCFYDQLRLHTGIKTIPNDQGYRCSQPLALGRNPVWIVDAIHLKVCTAGSYRPYVPVSSADEQTGHPRLIAALVTLLQRRLGKTNHTPGCGRRNGLPMNPVPIRASRAISTGRGTSVC